MKALIIEDDPEERRFLREGLAQAGYECEFAGDGIEGYGRLRTEPFDLAIVDLMLPRLDGKEVIRRVRAEGVLTPIVIVSALSQVSDRVAGLTIGADDYMPKPCSLDELKARIAAFNRRFSGVAVRILSAHGIMIDTVARTCRRNGRSIELSKIEFAILECLMRNRGRIIPEHLLLERAWGYDVSLDPTIIAPHVSRIKRKLVAENETFPIGHRRGFGYVFS